MNVHYNATGAPGFHSTGQSAAIRAEFAAVASGFDSVAAALAATDVAGLLTEVDAATLYFPRSGGSVVGHFVVQDDLPSRSRLQTTAGFSGFQAENDAGARQIELIYLGTGRGPAYGAPPGASVLNVQGALALSINDVQGFSFGAGGNMTALGVVTAQSFAGPLSGTVTGNVIGNVSGSSGTCIGNAATASYAATAGTAASASNVAWTGVTGRPTDLSAFTNGPGYVTSVGAAAAGALTGTTIASNVTASSLTSVGTLATLTVTAPINGSVTGSSASCTGNAATATVAASCSGNAATATTAGGISNSASNGYGARTVSTSAPSGGSDGDVWYQY
jgi:hypothetical protein